MAPVSIADLISSREYMHPEYDDRKLTVALLRNLLNHHDIDYSSCRTRSDFLCLLNEKVRGRGESQSVVCAVEVTHKNVGGPLGGSSRHTQVYISILPSGNVDAIDSL